MKKILLVFCLSCIIGMISCEKEARCADLVCVDDCLFVEVDRVGTVHYYSCYDTWGVLYTEDNESFISLVPDMKEEYQVENLAVVFSATFYENDIPLALPDPMPGRFYKVDICSININSN